MWLAGPTRMQGYLDDEAATAEVFRGPWLRTGDLGAVDDDGFLTLHGRIVEVIVRGGEKIHASQVESELGALEAVAEAAVVGVPDDVLQERVVACVVERAAATRSTPSEARADLRERIAEYAVPERFLVVDALPRNANGKIDRAQVRAAFDGGRRDDARRDPPGRGRALLPSRATRRRPCARSPTRSTSAPPASTTTTPTSSRSCSS